MLAILLLTAFIIGKLRKRERRRASNPGGPPPPEQVRENMQFTLRKTSSSVMKVADGGSSLSQAKEPEVSALIVKNSDHRYFIFTFVTFDIDAHLKFFAPFILALQGSDQGSCSESRSRVDIVDQEAPAHFQNNRRRARRRDNRLGKPYASACSSSVNINKNMHKSIVQNRQTEELCSSFSCKRIQNISGDGVSALASDGSDTTASTDPFKDKPELDVPTQKSSRKRAGKKGKKSKKSSSTSKQLVEGDQSNCHIDTCEDGWISMQKVAAANATTVSDYTENYNSSCSNATTEGSLLATTSCTSYIKAEELEGAFSVQDLDEGLSLGLSTVGGMTIDGNLDAEIAQTIVPNCDEFVFDEHSKKNTACTNVSSGNDTLDFVSDEWISNDSNCYTGGIENFTSVKEGLRSIISDSAGPSDGNCHGSSVEISSKRFIPGDATVDLNKEMPKSGDVLCSKVAADATILTTCRQESASGDTRSIVSSKKRKKRKQLQGSLQQACQMKKGANIHKPTGQENNPAIWDMVQNGKERQPLSADCDISMSLDGGHETHDTSSISVEIHNQVDVSGGAYEAVDSHTPSLKLEDKGLGKEILEKYEEKSYSILNQEQSYNFSEKLQDETSVIVDGEAVPISVDVQTSQYVQTDSSYIDHLIEFECRSDLCASLSAGSSIPVVNELGGPAVLEAKILNLELSRQDDTSGASSTKMVSDGMENAGISGISKPSIKATSSICDSLSARCNPKEVKEGKLSIVSDVKAAPGGLSTGSVNCLFSEQGQGKVVKLRHGAPCYLPVDLLASDVNDKKITMSELGTTKIVEIVRDAYMSQIESEGVQLAIGGPLAVFERLLHSASPVIGKLKSCRQCDTCKDENIGNSLCRHRIRNISLRKFWRWYQEAGSYGIEAKVEDVQMFKRLGPYRQEYSAYFIPLLSAVQLFGHSRSSSSETDMKGSPIFAMPLRQSVKENERVWQSDHNNFSSSSLVSSGFHSGGAELLFEYFEAEPPQQRQPVFAKVREIIRGECPTHCQVYGDPSKLGSLHLRELHPSSWYSVAWYPIYRIPDGNFRAAFLTYHSFGHFIQRDAPVASPHGGTSIVCPAVGLQSYNTQGEPWFSLRTSAKVCTAGGKLTEPGEVLNKRLQSLEATAHAMARACVHSGKQKSFNRHPDYEFFLSRRR